VRRIENREDSQVDPEAIQDLSKSLSLGPVIVQGYFDADSRRFGAAYKHGDYKAQVELRDVLLGLENVVGDLQDVLLDDNQIDFRQLQETSDVCRANAGVCLGQLSQRLAQARSDPMAMPFQSPSPQYMSSVPSVDSAGPNSDYSSSRSTDSSSGRRMPTTPDPSTQRPTLSPQWQPKRSGSSEQFFPYHRTQNTDAESQEKCEDWPQTCQLLTERDADELSVRRPSSHTLSPEDGVLLSTLRSHERARTMQKAYDPGDKDHAVNVSGHVVPWRLQKFADQSDTTNSSEARERYGPDDIYPIHYQEQHDPFLADGSSIQSLTSYASRTSSGHHSRLEQVTPEHRYCAEPRLLKLPKRSTQLPHRQISGPPSSPPPHKPIPPVPHGSLTDYAPNNRHTDILVQTPTRVADNKAPGPSQSHLRLTENAERFQRRVTPQSEGSPFRPSPQILRAMQSDHLRRQRHADQPPQHPLIPLTNPQSAEQPSGPSKRSSHTDLTQSSQPLYSHVPQQHGVQLPPHFQQLAPKLPPLPPVAEREAQPRTPALKPSPVTSDAIYVPRNLPLTLPMDKSTHPFCKGGFRLFLGLTKKAFVSANRPVGMSSFTPYWRCDKCYFEGPMREAPGPLDKKGRPGKPERIFDPTTRECGPISTAIIGEDGRGEGSGGVRYKWIFLAKCHVPLQNVPDKLDGSVGGYACIFCCAEGSARGWTTSAGGSHSLGMNEPRLIDAASTESGWSGCSSSATNDSTPVFENITSFMDHLHMHRKEENWPCPEMLGRMKCVVGRVADRNDDWEVNFLPL